MRGGAVRRLMSNVKKNNHFFFNIRNMNCAGQNWKHVASTFNANPRLPAFYFLTHKIKARTHEPCVLLLCAAAPPPGNDHLLILEHMV